MMTISGLMLRPGMGSLKLFQSVVTRERGEGEVMLTVKAVSCFSKSLMTELRKEEGLDRSRENLPQRGFMTSLLYQPNAGTFLFYFFNEGKKNDFFFFR